MIKALMRLFFGSKQQRDVKRLTPIVKEVNDIFAELQSLTDDQLRDKTSEFRRLLGVFPRQSRIGDQFVLHERAEDVLRTHPDISRCVFVGTRRDANPGELGVWIEVKPSVKVTEDLGLQVRGGMSRLGPGYVPKHVFITDEIPMTEDERGRPRIDINKLFLATEQAEKLPFRSVVWKDFAATLKLEEETYELMDLLPEAFAVMKETCRRHLGKKWMAAGIEVTWNAVPFDVQLMGGIALAEGNISEMGTGEGKTLTAILPLYLHALKGQGAHLVTVNDYLARRDSEWKTPLFNFLGLTVGCLDKSEPHTPERRAGYLSDVTYGTVNEFGFDYLRDNMARQKNQLCQREYAFGIIDEADSVLIDEARTPLIISGPVDRSTAQYDKILPGIRDLVAKQNMIVSRLAKEAEDLLEPAGKDLPWEAGQKMLACYKGAPKHKRYMKLRQEPTWARLQERVELEYIRDKKLYEVEIELLYVVDEKHRTVELTEKGRTGLSPENPNYFVISDIVDEFARLEVSELSAEEKEQAKRDARLLHDQKAEELHAISQLLHAYALKQRDVDYVVEDNKIVIVDENTGRKMAGRRWSDGLHQAIEAKESVKIEAETQTLATITIQNYFRMYKKLSGMTGTAETEAAEFHSTYKMDVICIPANRSTKRADLDDIVYRTKREKYNAVLDEIERLQKLGLPVLVGTTNVLDSEKLSKMLQGRKLKHNVLNAKNHAQEAQIVSEAGQVSAITIATNMAGRGTDIKLGPGAEKAALDPATNKDWPGGLQIIGTERHESRRIDRQLRGRSGRQGDPGSSRFFISLEDNLMLWFGSERISSWLEKLGMQDGEAIENPLVTRSITKAQQKVEIINHERRQRTLKFDDVMNSQRLVTYTLRRDFLTEDDLRPVLLGVFEDCIEAEFKGTFGGAKAFQDADLQGWIDWVETTIVSESLEDVRAAQFENYETLHEAVMGQVAAAFDDKWDLLGDVSIPFGRYVGLSAIDADWQDHLLAVDDLRESVYLRSHGQKDPLIEFTIDASAMFREFLVTVNKNILTTYFRAQPLSEDEIRERQRVRKMILQKPTAAAPDAPPEAPPEAQEVNGKPKSGLQPYRREYPKVGRNEPCPCGSGKKYKDCHGSAEYQERGADA